jgi:hypothetical protein
MFVRRCAAGCLVVLLSFASCACLGGSTTHTPEEAAVIAAIKGYAPHGTELSYALAMALRKSGYPRQPSASMCLRVMMRGGVCFPDEEDGTWIAEFSWKYSNESVVFSFSYDTATGGVGGANANGTCLVRQLDEDCVDCVCTSQP